MKREKKCEITRKNNSLEQQFPFTVPRCWISPQFPIFFSRFSYCLVATLIEEECSFIFLWSSLPRLPFQFGERRGCKQSNRWTLNVLGEEDFIFLFVFVQRILDRFKPDRIRNSLLLDRRPKRRCHALGSGESSWYLPTFPRRSSDVFYEGRLSVSVVYSFYVSQFSMRRFLVITFNIQPLQNYQARLNPLRVLDNVCLMFHYWLNINLFLFL